MIKLRWIVIHQTKICTYLSNFDPKIWITLSTKIPYIKVGTKYKTKTLIAYLFKFISIIKGINTIPNYFPSKNPVILHGWKEILWAILTMEQQVWLKLPSLVTQFLDWNHFQFQWAQIIWEDLQIQSLLHSYSFIYYKQKPKGGCNE